MSELRDIFAAVREARRNALHEVREWAEAEKEQAVREGEREHESAMNALLNHIADLLEVDES